MASVDGLLMPRKQNSGAEHELVLLDSFWQGLQSAEGASSAPFLRTQQAFDETSWSRTCQGLYRTEGLQERRRPQQGTCGSSASALAD